MNILDSVIAIESNSPRYQQIADDLLTRIQSGAIPLGEILKSEADLCIQYRASRGTVRKSLEQLQGLGVIMRRQREGTRVVSRFPSLGKLDNRLVLEDWARYGVDFPLTIESIAQRTPPDAEAVGAAGEKWLCTTGLRYPVGSRTPISFCQSFVHPDFSEIESSLSRTSIPIYAQIEEKYGRTITAVRAMLRATSLPEPIARKLNAATNSPALELTRHYLGESRRVIAVAINMHPADRYTHIIEVQRTS